MPSLRQSGVEVAPQLTHSRPSAASKATSWERGGPGEGGRGEREPVEALDLAFRGREVVVVEAVAEEEVAKWRVEAAKAWAAKSSFP